MPAIIHSQPYTVQYRMIGPKDGLSSRFTRGILQDKRGDIWISTLEGLDRYDGESIKSYVEGVIEGGNLLLESTEGALWIWGLNWRNYKGLPGMHDPSGMIFDPETERAFTFQEYFGGQAPFSEKEVFELRSGKEREIYIGTKSGKAYCYKNGRFELVLDNGGQLPMSAPLPGAAGSYWLRTPDAILNVDSSGRVLECEPLPFWPYSLNAINDTILLVRSGNHIWGTSYLKFPGRPGLFTHYAGKVDIRPFWSIQQSPDGLFWCLRTNELAVLDGSGDSVFDLDDALPLLREEQILPLETQLFFDCTGLAWLRLPENILLLEARNKMFQCFLDGRRMSIRGMAEIGPGRLFVNTYKGPQDVDIYSRDVQPVASGPLDVGIGACEAGDGGVWLASHKEMVAYGIPGEDEWEMYPALKGPDSVPVVTLQPFIDSKGRVWVGTEKGLAVVNTTAQQLQFYDTANEQFGLGKKSVRAIFENEEGLWLITDGGLFLLSLETEQLKRIEGLPFEDLYHLYESPDGRFWISSRGGGLICWDRRGGRFEQFTLEDGFSSNFIYAAYADEQGFLWLPSNNGLMRFDPESRKVTVLDKTHGLPSEEFNYTAHLRLADGRLAFGGIDGFIVLDPANIPLAEENLTPVSLLEFLQYDRSMGGMTERTAQIRKAGKIELRKGSNFFSLRFILQDYLAPEEHRYAYTIEGLEEEWHELNDNILRLGGFPYGEYNLRIRAMGRDGVWAENELRFPIVSYAPIYQQWWFVLLLVLLLAGLGVVVFRWRVRQLRRSKEELELEVARRTAQIEQDRKLIARQKGRLEEMNATKDKLFSILGHELRGPLMYFGNLAQRIGHYTEKKDFDGLGQLGEKARKAAINSSDLLDQLLQWSLMQSGRIKFQPGNIEVEPAILSAVQPLNQAAELKNIHIRYEFEPGLHALFDGQALGLIIRNLLSNAIKFSFDGARVTLRTFSKENRVAVEVQDEGVGMTFRQLKQIQASYLHPTNRGTAGEQGMGLGLSIVVDILGANGGEMKINSKKGEGTTLTVLLPSQAV